MTERPIDLSSLPSLRRPPAFAVLGAQGFALMASVVAGLGVAVYGFSPSSRRLMSSPARRTRRSIPKSATSAQPVSFADIVVERVKPSVISVKVNIGDKLAKDDSANRTKLAVPAGLADGALLPPLRRTGWLPPGMRGGPRGVPGDRPGFRLLHLA
jgi:serine protease Do